MTALQQFLTQTEQVPNVMLRQAMAQALGVETPRSSEAYARFYDRVLATLRSVDEDVSTSAQGSTMTLGIGSVLPCWC